MEDDPTATYGRVNRRPRHTPQQPPPGHVTFHLLCNYSHSGRIIGKSGSIVKFLQQETNSKIRIQDCLVRSAERIITVTGPDTPDKTITLKHNPEQEQEEEVMKVSPAQHGLVRVFERVLEVEAEAGDEFVPMPGVKKGFVNCRMLVDVSQIGFLMGKGKQRIKWLAAYCGAKIWVSPDRPACASQNLELVQMAGNILAVKKAILAVSQCLQDMPPLDKTQMVVSKPFMPDPDRDFSSSYAETLPPQSSLPPRASHSLDYASRSCSMPEEEEVVFRLLLSNDRVGGVIGKGGTVVRAIEEETGASIRVAALVAESYDRIIHISAMENVESQYSPAQNGVICVFKRSIELGNETMMDSGATKDLMVEARLLISLDQAGCLIGVGGSRISEMRKATCTSMWILQGDQVPPCATENDSVVQMSGYAQNVQHALFIVTGKLRSTFFHSKMVNTDGRIEKPTSSGSYPSLDYFRQPSRPATLTESMNRLAIDHSTSFEPRRSRTGSGENLRGFMNTGRGAADLRGSLEYSSGSRSALVTNTTLEIIVPEHIFGFVDREKESNLSRLRQISGAKIRWHDPFPGSSEATLVISGTPDQTQVAQSVLQALLSGGEGL